MTPATQQQPEPRPGEFKSRWINSCHRCGQPGMSSTYAPGLCRECGEWLRGYAASEKPQGATDLELFDGLRVESRETFIQKNQAYGAAYNRRGLLGVLVRMEDKIARAFRLLEGAGENDEALRDTLLDLENYATIARIVESRGNLRGMG